MVGHEARPCPPVGVERRHRLEHRDERHLARLVVRDRGFDRHLVLRDDAAVVERDELLGAFGAREALLRPVRQLQIASTRRRGSPPFARISASATALSRAFLLNGQDDADARQPHRVEAAAVHVAALDREVGLESRRARAAAAVLVSIASAAPELGADGARLVDAPRRDCGQRRAARAWRRLDRRVERARQQPVDLGQPHLGFGRLLDGALLDARHLGLHAQHVRLGALADGVPGADHDLDLPPQFALFVRQRLELAREQQAVVRAPHGALEREPRARERRLDLAGLARGEAGPAGRACRSTAAPGSP